MGSLVQESCKYIKIHYPEMNIILENGSYLVWEGRFYVDIEYEEIKVNSAPRLGIKFSKSYPNELPIVYDIDNIFNNTTHKFVNPHPENEEIEKYRNKRTLCLASFIDMDLQLSNSSSIEDYITKFLLPYFISYESSVKTGKYVFGERTHGSKGIYESIAEYFQVEIENIELLKKLLIWSTRTTRFKTLFSPPYHKYIEKKYYRKIGHLRKTLSTIKLKRHLYILNKLEIEENTHKKLRDFLNRGEYKEAEKVYIEYLSKAQRAKQFD
ncbi:MAG: hypothetical protein CVV48_10650 [Spirochaetae bacterium HGW-Spirochaetae-4]|jgi:hypothetical protein|nr:MAG: hypothetical protein CVV48_10650 [Spirochaetae bacterium HGW-Spirochaetae-4]